MPEARLPGRVVVAGTGKMAFNIGLFCLVRGATVHWLSRSPERAAAARGELERLLRRQQRVDPDFNGAGRARIDSLDMLPDPGGAPDLIIESSSEEASAKRAWARSLAKLGGAATLRLTNSSSMLPNVLGPDWLGCHFFYPVDLHQLVEIVLPDQPGAPDHARAGQARALLEGLGFRCLLQDAGHAFAINRLLLPLQDLALDCLRQGWDPALVDELSATPCLPVSILSGMDAIGLDVIRVSVGNYLAGPEAGRAAILSALPAALDQVLALGKQGIKNKNGLLSGDPLPWERSGQGDPEPLRRRFAALAEATCRQAVARGDFRADELAWILDDLWGGTLP